MKFKPVDKKTLAFINDIHKQIDNCLDGNTAKSFDQKKIDGWLRTYLHIKGVDVAKYYWHGRKTDAFRKKFGEFPKFFGSTNLPDFVILKPHRIVIEYKKCSDADHIAVGEKMKALISQCLAHAYSGKYDVVLGFYRDATKAGLVHKSMQEKTQKAIIKELETKNIFLRAVKK